MSRLRFLPICALIAFTGCVTTEPQPPLASTGGERDAHSATKNVLPYSDIPLPQLQNLLEAEFAIRAGELPLGLQKLSATSIAIPDPALARRALRLAQFVKEPTTILAMGRRLSDLAPDDAEAATLAAAMLIERNNIAEALPYARRAFALAADINPAALLNQYSDQAPDTQALINDLIQQLSAESPNDPRSLFAHALLAWRQGNTTDTEKRLTTLFDLVPYHERGILLATEMRSRTNDPAAFDQLLAAIDKTGSPLLRYQYARHLMGQQKLAQASAQFDLLAETTPANVDYVMGAALLSLELADPTAALVNLERVIALQQRLPEAYLYKGIALTSLSDSTGALAAFAQVPPSASFPRALKEATALLLTTGDETRIDRYFAHQHQRSFNEPHSAQAELVYLSHADALSALDSIRALEVLSVGIDRLSQSTRLLYARAGLLERSNQFKGAEADYRAILLSKPGDAGALNALGYALTNNTDRFAEAATLLEEAISKDPRNPAIIDSLGWVYFKLGKHREAEVLLKEAYQQYPDPEVASHLVELLWSQGREIEARDLIASQLKTSPANRFLRDVALRLSIPLSD